MNIECSNFFYFLFYKSEQNIMGDEMAKDWELEALGELGGDNELITKLNNLFDQSNKKKIEANSLL